MGYRRRGFCHVYSKTCQYNIKTAAPGILFHQTFPVLMSAGGGLLLCDVIHGALPL